MGHRSDNRHRSLGVLLGMATVAISLPSPAPAQMRWDGSASSDWTDGNNWNPSAAPTAGSSPVISGPAASMPVLSGGATTLSTLYLGYDKALGGAGLTITGGAGLMTSSATIGEQSNNNAGNAREVEAGTASLLAASTWTSGTFQIGAYGTGALTVSGGSTLTTTTSASLGVHHNSVTNRSGEGTLTILGANSTWISNGVATIGNLGHGTVSVMSGGKITTRATTLGHGATGSGTVTVDGIGSRWEASSGTLVIGNSGTGQFTVSGGASAKTTGRINLAASANSSGTLTVTGKGSRLEADQIWAGLGSTGSIGVNSGGVIQAAQLRLGTTASGSGRADLRGTGSMIASSAFTAVGLLGEGELTVADNATLRGTVRIALLGGSKGALNIGAAAGSAAETAGIVDAATVEFGAGTGKLVFNHTNADYKFAGQIMGVGNIQHHAGTTLLTGNSTTFTGTTTISGGALLVGGALGGSVSVLSGGTLGGSGTVGATTVGAGGTLSPGNSPGTLTVNGNLVMGAGAIYLAELQGPLADRVNVTGSASLGGTLRLAQLGGAYAFSTPFTLLSAAGGLAGTRFGTFDPAGSFGDGVATGISYTGTDVLLTLTPKPLAPMMALSGGAPAPANAFAMASGIDRAVASGANPSVLFGIYNLRAAAIPAALNQLSGEAHTAAPAMANSAAGQFLGTLLDGSGAGRLSGGPGGPGGAAGFTADLPSKQDGPGRSTFDPARFSLWGAGFGSTGRSDGDRIAGSANRNLSDGHAAVGADIRIGSNTVVGAAVAGGQSRASLSGGLGKAEADVFQAGLYGRTVLGTVNLAAALGYARLDTDTTRAIPAIGLTGVTASYVTQAWSGRIEASLPVATWGGFTLSPLAAFQAVRASSPAAIERAGSGAAAGTLTLARRADMTSRSELGLQFDANLIASATPVTGFVRAAWAHYYQRDADLTASLNGLPGASFAVTGAKPDRNAALLAAGADVKLSQSVSVGIRIDSEISENTRRVGGTAQLRVSF